MPAGHLSKRRFWRWCLQLLSFGFNCAQRLRREILQWGLKPSPCGLRGFADTYGCLWWTRCWLCGSPASAGLQHPAGWVLAALESNDLYTSRHCLLRRFQTREGFSLGKWGTGMNSIMINWETADKINDWKGRLAQRHCERSLSWAGRFPLHIGPVSLNQIS